MDNINNNSPSQLNYTLPNTQKRNTRPKRPPPDDLKDEQPTKIFKANASPLQKAGSVECKCSDGPYFIEEDLLKYYSAMYNSKLSFVDRSNATRSFDLSQYSRENLSLFEDLLKTSQLTNIDDLDAMRSIADFLDSPLVLDAIDQFYTQQIKRSPLSSEEEISTIFSFLDTESSLIRDAIKEKLASIIPHMLNHLAHTNESRDQLFNILIQKIQEVQYQRKLPPLPIDLSCTLANDQLQKTLSKIQISSLTLPGSLQTISPILPANLPLSDKLIFSHTSFVPGMLESIPNSIQKRLKELIFNRCNFTLIHNFPIFSSLKTLRMSICITPNIINRIYFPSLKNLFLGNAEISQAMLQYIPNDTNQKIKHLKFYHCNFTSTPDLSKFYSLKKLYFNHTNIDDDSLNRMLDQVKSTIKELSISGNEKITPQLNLSGLPPLECLNLSVTNISNDTINSIPDSSKQTIKNLNILFCNNLTDSLDLTKFTRASITNSQTYYKDTLPNQLLNFPLALKD